MDPRPRRRNHATYGRAVPAEVFDTSLISERAMQFVEAQCGGPILAWISIPDPHHSLQMPGKHARKIAPEQVKLSPFRPDEMKTKVTRMQICTHLIRGSKLPDSFLREFLRVHYAMTVFIDDEPGRRMGIGDASLHRVHIMPALFGLRGRAAPDWVQGQPGYRTAGRALQKLLDAGRF